MHNHSHMLLTVVCTIIQVLRCTVIMALCNVSNSGSPGSDVSNVDCTLRQVCMVRSVECTVFKIARCRLLNARSSRLHGAEF